MASLLALVLSLGAVSLALAASGGECPDDYQVVVKAEDVTVYVTEDTLPAGTKVDVPVKVMNTTPGVDTIPLNSWGVKYCGDELLQPYHSSKGDEYCKADMQSWTERSLPESQWVTLTIVQFELKETIPSSPTRVIEIAIDSLLEEEFKFRYKCSNVWYHIDVQQFESGSVTFTQPTDSTVTFAMDTAYCDPDIDSTITVPVSFVFDTSGTLRQFEVEISWDSLALDLVSFSEGTAFPADWTFASVDIRGGYAHFYAADTSGGCDDVIQGDVFDLHFRRVYFGDRTINFGQSNSVGYCHGNYKPGNLVNGVVVFVDKVPPSAVMDLSVKYAGSDYVNLSWTAPGNDGNQGTAYRYDIRYSTEPVGADTVAWWEGADTVADEPAPAPAGTGEQFEVGGLVPHTTYYFALKTADEVPNWSGISNIVSGTPVGVKRGGSSKLPLSFALFPNYPNPFNSKTEIRYGLPIDCRVRLEVYNITGERVATLVNQRQGAGYHRVTWDASGMASGVYLCRMKAGGFTKTQKMVLLK